MPKPCKALLNMPNIYLDLYYYVCTRPKRPNVAMYPHKFGAWRPPFKTQLTCAGCIPNLQSPWNRFLLNPGDAAPNTKLGFLSAVARSQCKA